jgi:hypothetical protein
MIAEIAYYLFFVITMACMALFLYHNWGMLHNVREDRRISATLLAPFIPLMSEMFTEKGNYHRKRVGWYLICLVILLPFLVFIDWVRRV